MHHAHLVEDEDEEEEEEGSQNKQGREEDSEEYVLQQEMTINIQSKESVKQDTSLIQEIP